MVEEIVSTVILRVFTHRAGPYKPTDLCSECVCVCEIGEKEKEMVTERLL